MVGREDGAGGRTAQAGQVGVGHMKGPGEGGGCRLRQGHRGWPHREGLRGQPN